MSGEIVWLDQWNHPVYGERWTIMRGDRAPLLTYATEEQARAACQRFGWTLSEAGFSRGVDLEIVVQGEANHDEL